MTNIEPSMVMKYVDHLDAFVKFRIFSKDGITHLLEGANITDRQSYVSMVLDTCVPQIPKSARDRMEVNGGSVEPLRELLYDVCVGLNPGLDIHRVVLPVDHAAGLEPASKRQKDVKNTRGTGRKLNAKELAAALGKRVIGQDEALEVLARAVARSNAGLRDPERPVGTFLFIGQTGVGKTELAKALAEVLASEERQPFVRIDCSEYSLPHEYAKLIGAPPGYVGHEQGGYLASVMSKANANVVLFDEIEKADEKVHNLLLQIMDEGFVTDAKGQRIDFTGSIIILTSNQGAGEVDALNQKVGFGLEKRKVISHETRLQAIHDSLRKKFKPEFLNRIDETVLFRSLNTKDAGRILDKFVDLLKQRAYTQGIQIELSSNAHDWLLERGFSEAFGARELRRTVQRMLETPMAEALLSAELPQGGKQVVHVSRDTLIFKPENSTAPQTRGRRKSASGRKGNCSAAKGKTALPVI